jgi:hypothetical protein
MEVKDWNIIYTTLFITLCATIGCLYAHFDNIFKKYDGEIKCIKQLIISEKEIINKKNLCLEDEYNKKLEQHSVLISSIFKEIQGTEHLIENVDKKIDDNQNYIKKELTHIHEILKNLDELSCNNAIDINKFVKEPIAEKERIEKERIEKERIERIETERKIKKNIEDTRRRLIEGW